MDPQKLLVVALDLLRRKVADLATAYIHNQTNPPAPAAPPPDPQQAPAPAPAVDPETGQFVPPPPASPAPPPTGPQAPPPTAPGQSPAGAPAGPQAGQSVLATLTAILGQLRQAKSPAQAAAGKAGATLRKNFKRLQKAVRSKRGRMLAAGALGGAAGVLAARGAAKVAGKAVGAAKAGGAKLIDLIKPILGPLGALLTPAKVLADVLASNASGFQLVGTAMKLLAATIAPLLLPVFVMLATGITELSDKIWADFGPALEGFYGMVVNTLLPAVTAIVQAFQDAADFFQDVISQIPGADAESPYLKDADGNNVVGADGRTVRVRDPGAGVFEGGAGAGGAVDFGGTRDAPGATGGDRRGGRPAEASAPGAKSSTKGAMADVLRELRLSVGPRASTSGLADLNRNAAMAALNQSPFEAKLLQRIDAAVGAMERVAANTEAEASGRYTAGGDF